MPAHRADGRAARGSTGRAAAIGLAALLLASAAASPAAAAPIAEAVVPTRLAIVVPVTVPPRAGGLIAAEELAALTAPGGDLTRLLDAVGSRRVTLAVDPLIAASVHELGPEAPASARAWIDRLDDAPQDRFPLLTGDADPTLLRQAGEPLPALGTVWPSPGTTSPEDVAAFADAGGLRILLADTDLAERPDPSTALASVQGTGVAVVDTAASAALATAVERPSSASLGALRAAIAGPGGRGSVVAALGRGAGPGGLGDVLAALDADLGLDLVGLDALSGATAEAVVADGAQPAARVELYRQVVAAEAADAAFAAIAAQPERIREDRRLRSLALASVAWAADPAWPAAVAEAVADSAALRAGVRIAEADSLVLADRSSIPVSIVNDLDQPVTVVVSVRAANGRLDIDETPVTVEVPAAARVSASFDYTAVSNGSVRVTARLASVDGATIGQPAVATVNVQAGWETPIAAAAAGVLLLVIVVGIIRTARRVRRARGASESPADRG